MIMQQLDYGKLVLLLVHIQKMEILYKLINSIQVEVFNAFIQVTRHHLPTGLVLMMLMEEKLQFSLLLMIYLLILILHSLIGDGILIILAQIQVRIGGK